ncbi:hypothetical protein HMPREF9446_03252 [Bacteroides fluxus YIT 12057]|uniref:Uncharacterized protein n=1 Tax=Bacteroides fluxus YIT 12057 TaxID=763034 RepID=F3PWW5_9BACE|nr:hypothetical protein HMPREF9446_03252 [Bacteroides fluxus YIT 12057]
MTILNYCLGIRRFSFVICHNEFDKNSFFSDTYESFGVKKAKRR